jgi:Fanconi anemia group M protein
MKPSQEVEVVVDSREPSEIIDELEACSTNDYSVIPRVETLEVGDYVVSPEIAFERKTFPDFLHSAFDENEQHEKGYLMRQVADLAREYRRPALIIEGQELMELYTLRPGIHPNSIRGKLYAIANGFRVPIIWTMSTHDTAEMLVIAAKKAQLDNHTGKPSPHGKRSHLSLDEKQIYLITSIMGVGVDTATRLLNHFHTPRAIMSATVSELVSVPNIGPKTAKTITEVVSTKYKP